MLWALVEEYVLTMDITLVKFCQSHANSFTRSSLILLYPWHFRVLLLAVSTPTSCVYRWHTALLTSVCEHPESTRAMHSRLSISTFTTGNCRFFTCSERRLALALTPSPLQCFTGTLMKWAQFRCIKNTVVCSQISVLRLTPLGVQFLTI